MSYGILQNDISSIVKAALEEDIGSGDVTSSLTTSAQEVAAEVTCRENAVICGIPWFNEVFTQIDPLVDFQWQVNEGDCVAAETKICRLRGNPTSLLQGERTALNFLQTLSGTATITRQYVERLSGTGTRILDTRKTIPGLRIAQKYAVKIGGGTNHRLGLHDGVLIKENHQCIGMTLNEMVDRLPQDLPNGFLIEVEIENLNQLEAAIASGANRIMLDNFTIEDITTAVKVVDGRVDLEASGSFLLESVREVAQTGVDYISVGAITKHLHAVDFSMLFNQPF